MTETTVAIWGKALVSGVLQDVGREAGLIDGDKVNIEIQKGEIVISKWLPPLSPEQKARARKALEEITADSKCRSLGGVSIRKLIDEGRPRVMGFPGASTPSARVLCGETIEAASGLGVGGRAKTQLD